MVDRQQPTTKQSTVAELIRRFRTAAPTDPVARSKQPISVWWDPEHSPTRRPLSPANVAWPSRSPKHAHAELIPVACIANAGSTVSHEPRADAGRPAGHAHKLQALQRLAASCPAVRQALENLQLDASGAVSPASILAVQRAVEASTAALAHQQRSHRAASPGPVSPASSRSISPLQKQPGPVSSVPSRSHSPPIKRRPAPVRQPPSRSARQRSSSSSSSSSEGGSVSIRSALRPAPKQAPPPPTHSNNARTSPDRSAAPSSRSPSRGYSGRSRSGSPSARFTGLQQRLERSPDAVRRMDAALQAETERELGVDEAVGSAVGNGPSGQSDAQGVDKAGEPARDSSAPGSVWSSRDSSPHDSRRGASRSPQLGMPAPLEDTGAGGAHAAQPARNAPGQPYHPLARDYPAAAEASDLPTADVSRATHAGASIAASRDISEEAVSDTPPVADCKASDIEAEAVAAPPSVPLSAAPSVPKPPAEPLPVPMSSSPVGTIGSDPTDYSALNADLAPASPRMDPAPVADDIRCAAAAVALTEASQVDVSSVSSEQDTATGMHPDAGILHGNPPTTADEQRLDTKSSDGGCADGAEPIAAAEAACELGGAGELQGALISLEDATDPTEKRESAVCAQREAALSLVDRLLSCCEVSAELTAEEAPPPALSSSQPAAEVSGRMNAVADSAASEDRVELLPDLAGVDASPQTGCSEGPAAGQPGDATVQLAARDNSGVDCNEAQADPASSAAALMASETPARSRVSESAGGSDEQTLACHPRVSPQSTAPESPCSFVVAPSCKKEGGAAEAATDEGLCAAAHTSPEPAQCPPAARPALRGAGDCRDTVAGVPATTGAPPASSPEYACGVPAWCGAPQGAWAHAAPWWAVTGSPAAAHWPPWVLQLPPWPQALLAHTSPPALPVWAQQEAEEATEEATREPQSTAASQQDAQAHIAAATQTSRDASTAQIGKAQESVSSKPITPISPGSPDPLDGASPVYSPDVTLARECLTQVELLPCSPSPALSRIAQAVTSELEGMLTSLHRGWRYSQVHAAEQTVPLAVELAETASLKQPGVSDLQSSRCPAPLTVAVCGKQHNAAVEAQQAAVCSVSASVSVQTEASAAPLGEYVPGQAEAQQDLPCAETARPPRPDSPTRTLGSQTERVQPLVRTHVAAQTGRGVSSVQTIAAQTEAQAALVATQHAAAQAGLSAGEAEQADGLHNLVSPESEGDAAIAQLAGSKAVVPAQITESASSAADEELAAVAEQAEEPRLAAAETVDTDAAAPVSNSDRRLERCGEAADHGVNPDTLVRADASHSGRHVGGVAAAAAAEQSPAQAAGSGGSVQLVYTCTAVRQHVSLQFPAAVHEASAAAAQPQSDSSLSPHALMPEPAPAPPPTQRQPTPDLVDLRSRTTSPARPATERSSGAAQSCASGASRHPEPSDLSLFPWHSLRGVSAGGPPLAPATALDRSEAMAEHRHDGRCVPRCPAQRQESCCAAAEKCAGCSVPHGDCSEPGDERAAAQALRQSWACSRQQGGLRMQGMMPVATGACSRQWPRPHVGGCASAWRAECACQHAGRCRCGAPARERHVACARMQVACQERRGCGAAHSTARQQANRGQRWHAPCEQPQSQQDAAREPCCCLHTCTDDACAGTACLEAGGQNTWSKRCCGGQCFCR